MKRPDRYHLSRLRRRAEDSRRRLGRGRAALAALVPLVPAPVPRLALDVLGLRRPKPPRTVVVRRRAGTWIVNLRLPTGLMRALRAESGKAERRARAIRQMLADPDLPYLTQVMLEASMDRHTEALGDGTYRHTWTADPGQKLYERLLELRQPGDQVRVIRQPAGARPYAVEIERQIGGRPYGFGIELSEFDVRSPSAPRHLWRLAEDRFARAAAHWAGAETDPPGDVRAALQRAVAGLAESMGFPAPRVEVGQVEPARLANARGRNSWLQIPLSPAARREEVSSYMGPSILCDLPELNRQDAEERIPLTDPRPEGPGVHPQDMAEQLYGYLRQSAAVSPLRQRIIERQGPAPGGFELHGLEAPGLYTWRLQVPGPRLWNNIERELGARYRLRAITPAAGGGAGD